MAEMLNAANTAFDAWLERTSDTDKPDRLLIYMAFLGGFQSGYNHATEGADDGQ